MNKYLMTDAIGNLDTDLLDDHLNKKNELMNTKKTTNSTVSKRMLPLVACLSLLSVIGVIMFFTTLSVPDEPSTDEHLHTLVESFYYQGDVSVSSTDEHLHTLVESFYYQGDVSVCEYGKIQYLEYDDDSITLLIEKKTDDCLYATLYGYSEESKETQTHKNVVYCATTKNDYTDENVVLVDDGLKIYVDGEPSAGLPQKKGKYEVQIVYGNIKNKCERLGIGIFIDGFDYFVVNPLVVVDPKFNDLGTKAE